MNDPVSNLMDVGHVMGGSSGQDYSRPYLMEIDNVEGGRVPMESGIPIRNNILHMEDMMCQRGMDNSFSQLPSYSNQIDMNGGTDMNMMNNHSYPEVFPNIGAQNNDNKDLNNVGLNFTNNYEPPAEQNLIFNNPEFSSGSNCPLPNEGSAVSTNSFNMFPNNSVVETQVVPNHAVTSNSQFGYNNSLGTQLANITEDVHHSAEHFTTDLDLFSPVNTELTQGGGEVQGIEVTPSLGGHDMQSDASVQEGILELDSLIDEHSATTDERVFVQESETLPRAEPGVLECREKEQANEENEISVERPNIYRFGIGEELCKENEINSFINGRGESLREEETTPAFSMRGEIYDEVGATSLASELRHSPQENIDSALERTLEDTMDDMLSGNIVSGRIDSTKNCTGGGGEPQTEENNTKVLDSSCGASLPGNETTSELGTAEGVQEDSETALVTDELRCQTGASRDSPEVSTQFVSQGSQVFSSGLTTDCSASENSDPMKSGELNEVEKENDRLSIAPVSPIITMLDSNLGEDDSSTRGSDAEGGPSTSESNAVITRVEISETTRLTRAKTGTLPSKPVRLVEEVNAEMINSEPDLDDLAIMDDNGHYKEEALLAPIKVDPSITVPEDVLRVTPEEKKFYENMFPCGVEAVLRRRLHCTACGRHMGATPAVLQLSNRHKVLRVLICNRCRSFYGKGKFNRDSDGSELFCRWCGQGGEVVCCSHCPNVFCLSCLRRNLGPSLVKDITNAKEWKCLVCDYKRLWHFRAICWALFKYSFHEKEQALRGQDPSRLWTDVSRCCSKSKKSIGIKPPEKPSCPPGTKLPEMPSCPAGTPCNPPATPSDPHEAPSNPDIDSSRTLPHIDPQLQEYSENFARGHFLFRDGNEDCAVSESAYSDDESAEIDPSLFVQPVLEEQSPPRPQGFSRIRNVVSEKPKVVWSVSPKPIAPRALPIPAPPLAPLSFGRMNGPVSASSPRIFVRNPATLLRPGLVPLPKPSDKPPVAFLNENTAKKTLLTNSSFRNSVPNFSSVDGVRSMDQLEGLNSVPWFRNGIDSLRAVGFAITKRVRDLEARFHTLKNKGDAEKVMALGKKLDRLSRKASLRYKQVSVEICDGCHHWKASKLNRASSSSRHSNADPFMYIDEQDSDWVDDKELHRPLEKVMIPVNTAALHGANTHSKLMALAVKALPSNINSKAKTVNVSSKTVPANLNRTATQTSSAVPVNNVQTKFVRITPKPQEPTPSNLNVSCTNGSVLAKMLHNTNMVDSVGNSVSITVTNTLKRKRVDSDRTEETTSSISELMSRYNIRPCFVRLKKCDDLVVSYKGPHRIHIDATEYDKNEDDDDDIQIIEEVSHTFEDRVMLPTVLCASSLCETIE